MKTLIFLLFNVSPTMNAPVKESYVVADLEPPDDGVHRHADSVREDDTEPSFSDQVHNHSNPVREGRWTFNYAPGDITVHSVTGGDISIGHTAHIKIGDSSSQSPDPSPEVSSKTSLFPNIWTVDCGLLTTQRMDPIIFPGVHPSIHVHSIVGGSKFNPSVTNQELLTSKCTSCNVKEDLSNYWFPHLYIHKKSNEKFYFVDMEFHVYYKLVNDRGQTDSVHNILQPGEILAFPPGFQMVAGKPFTDKPLSFISHTCLRPSPLPPITTPGFPPSPEQCLAVRSEVTFPSCWNGLLPKSGLSTHMKFPHSGLCPSTHPKRLPTLSFEVVFKTGDIFEAGDELVYSFNDTSGYGFHGDFLQGWKDGIMGEIINNCTVLGGREDGCGIHKQAGGGACQWEGTEDPQRYRGILEDLPPHDNTNPR